MPQDEQALDELRAACTAGRLDEVEEMFNTGRMSAEDASKALEEAVNDLAILRCLLEHGADPQALELRVVKSIETLKLLAGYGYDFEKQGHLILQDFAEDRDTLEWLLQQGADINKSDYGRTASGFFLYEGGFDYSVKTLNIASANGDIKFFDLLVHHGADPARSLALHYVSKCKDPEKASKMLSLLLDKYNMDIHADTDALRNFFHDAQDSGTPLCSAIYHRNLTIVEALLGRGASPEQSGASGYSPIIKAVGHALFEGFLPALQPLLEAGADSNNGLQCSVSHGKFEAAEMCLAFGADAKVGIEAAHRAERSRIEDFETNGLEKDAEALKADEAAKQRHSAMMEMLQAWESK